MNKELLQQTLDALVNAMPCTTEQANEQTDAIAALRTELAAIAQPAVSDATKQAIRLCEWIAETPHVRGSINGLAAQVRHALTALPAPVSPEPVAHLWQHGETGRTRVVMPDQIFTADANWFVVGPLVLASTQGAPAQALDVTVRFDDNFLEEWSRPIDDGTYKLVPIATTPTEGS